MRVRYIRVGRLKSLPGYENIRIEIECVLNDNEDPLNAYERIVQAVDRLCRIEHDLALFDINSLKERKENIERKIAEIEGLLSNRNLVEKIKSIFKQDVSGLEAELTTYKERLEEINAKLQKLAELKKQREQVFSEFLNVNVRKRGDC